MEKIIYRVASPSRYRNWEPFYALTMTSLLVRSLLCGMDKKRLGDGRQKPKVTRLFKTLGLTLSVAPLQPGLEQTYRTLWWEEVSHPVSFSRTVRRKDS